MKFVLTCLTLLVFTGLAAAADKPTQAVPAEGCVTAECHAEIKNYRVIHGPVNVNACESCHTLVSAEEHTFQPARAGAEMCTFCHEVSTAGAKVVHQPLIEGQCTSCHDPHGGRTRSMIRGNTVRDACNSCHTDVASKKHVHGPAAAGACDSCHTSHTSKFDNLLTNEGNALCFDCHTDMQRQLNTVKFKHEAVEGNCLDCHDSHSSDFVMQTKLSPADLCLSCHEDDIKNSKNAMYQHTVVTDAAACLNCHTAHGSQLADLMKSQETEICMDCHAKPVQTPQGRKVAAVAEVNDPKTIKHGPVREGNCSGCHQSHGSDISRLLSKEYSPAFYQDYEAQKYELCFTCHDQQLVQTAEARGLTGFRNGEQNLHFVHVNREKGRNCRSCHSTHASPNELHVRDTVPYGNWVMPIAFVRSETGGTCTPGCHRKYTYDRDNPQVYEPMENP